MFAIFIKKIKDYYGKPLPLSIRKWRRLFPSIKLLEESHMFYIKTNLASGKTIRTDITDENVFTHCPECGRELPVDLAELFSSGEGDLFSTSILCCVCTKKHTGKRRHIDGIEITTDGLALLSDVLCQAGYGEQVFDLFKRFEIDAVQELTPEQYEPFANALLEIATVGCEL